MPALIGNLALEIAPIRVNLIAPGFVDTPLSASLLGDGLDARREQLRSTLPIGRVVGPEDVAALAVHLMTNTAAHGRDLRHRRRAAAGLAGRPFEMHPDRAVTQRGDGGGLEAGAHAVREEAQPAAGGAAARRSRSRCCSRARRGRASFGGVEPAAEIARARVASLVAGHRRPHRGDVGQATMRRPLTSSKATPNSVTSKVVEISASVGDDGRILKDRVDKGR